jgi:hypothetical protein
LPAGGIGSIARRPDRQATDRNDQWQGPGVGPGCARLLACHRGGASTRDAAVPCAAHRLAPGVGGTAAGSFQRRTSSSRRCAVERVRTTHPEMVLRVEEVLESHAGEFLPEWTELETATTQGRSSASDVMPRHGGGSRRLGASSSWPWVTPMPPGRIWPMPSGRTSGRWSDSRIHTTLQGNSPRSAPGAARAATRTRSGSDTVSTSSRNFRDQARSFWCRDTQAVASGRYPEWS